MAHDFECNGCDDCCGKAEGTYSDRFCATDSSQTCTDIGSNMDYIFVSYCSLNVQVVKGGIKN